jgi:hypothetical protein
MSKSAKAPHCSGNIPLRAHDAAAIVKAIEHLDAAEAMLDEIEALSVLATVAADVDQGVKGGCTTAGLYGTDWAPMAKIAMRRIMELVTNTIPVEFTEARERMCVLRKQLAPDEREDAA